MHVEDLLIRFVGAWEVEDSVCNQMASELEASGHVVREKPIPKGEVWNRMLASSWLLVLQQDFPLQIPAKLYEYISTKRPLLLLGDEGATKSLIDNYKLGVCCPNDVEKIKQAIRNLKSSETAFAPDDASFFDYRNISHKVANVLDDAIAIQDSSFLDTPLRSPN